MSKIIDLRAAAQNAVPEQWRGDPAKINLAHVVGKKHAQQEARRVRQVASAVPLVREDLYAEMRRINGASINTEAAISAELTDDEFERGMRALDRGDNNILKIQASHTRRRAESRAKYDIEIEQCNQLLAEIGRELHRLRDIVLRIKDIELSA